MAPHHPEDVGIKAARTPRRAVAAAGVSVGTVTYHLGSVQEILSEALRLLVGALFTEDTDRHWRMWFDYWNAGDQDPDQAFARGQAERYEAWHTRIRELAERGVAEGEFSSRT
ncbi:TetR family transcriptional regulator C-terminal domain-containing protein [Streptomyces mirabilis]|uniref:TetR family transcriptional regulator C-terminal domain-containing protein n=1 Tax=Streptomyces mirabilis TaxID=68239 RepID=UPI0036C890EC